MSCDFNKLFNGLRSKEKENNLNFGVAKLLSKNPFTIEFQGEQYTSKGFTFYKVQEEVKENQYNIEIKDFEVNDLIFVLTDGYTFYLFRKVVEL